MNNNYRTYSAVPRVDEPAREPGFVCFSFPPKDDVTDGWKQQQPNSNNETNKTAKQITDILKDQQAMASVLQSSTEGYGIMRVHFGCDIDWEEEDRRSYRGADSRRRQKERKLEMAQQKELKDAALEVVRDRQYENDIVELCQDEAPLGGAFRSVVHDFIGNGAANAVDGESADEKLRRVLQEFRNAEKATLQSLNEHESKALDTLKSFYTFLERFREILPSQVVTSGSEDSGENSPENSPEREKKRQRQERLDETQSGESRSKRNWRKWGGPVEFVQANHHIPEEKQN